MIGRFVPGGAPSESQSDQRDSGHEERGASQLLGVSSAGTGLFPGEEQRICTTGHSGECHCGAADLDGY
jgi:hypothetical protein